MNPKISVVMPVYNDEKYLRECLDCLVSQTLKDIEIICVNDGSTDGTLSILNEYAGKDPRVKVISQENQGPGAARNTGLNSATGEYLALLDSDDVYDRSMLEKLLGLAEQNGLDIAICRSQTLDNKTGKLIETPWCIRKDMLPKKKVFSCRDISIYNFRFSVGWSWDKLFRREFIERNALRFQPLRNADDALFVFVSLVLAEKIAVIDDILVSHRRNTGTQVSASRDRNPACFIDAILGIKKTLQDKNIYEEAEQGFVIWCAEHTMWQMNSLSLASQVQIYDKMVSMLEEINAFHRPASYFDHKQDEQLKARLQNLGVIVRKAERLKRKIRKYKILQAAALGLVPQFRKRKNKYRDELSDLLSGK